jgi:hypothetical protein
VSEVPDQQSTPTANRREDLERSAVDQLHSALDAGDVDAARKAADGILLEERPIHDLYGDMCASFLTYIAEKLGEEGVDEAWRHVANDVWRPELLGGRR